jgi:hypothetical protein
VPEHHLLILRIAEYDADFETRTMQEQEDTMHNQLQTMKKMSTRLISPTPSRGIKSSEDMPSPDVRRIDLRFLNYYFKFITSTVALKRKSRFRMVEGLKAGMYVYMWGKGEGVVSIV